MANLTDIIKVTASQYNTLINGGTVSGRTYDANALYLVEDSSSVVTSVNGESGAVSLDYDDVGAAPAVSGGYLPKSGGTMTGTITTPINSGAAIQFRDDSSYRSGISYRANGNEAVCFENNYSVTSWIFRTKNPATNSGSWDDVTPSLQIKNQRVAINKLISNGTDAAYNLDVNGTANATTLYENGTALSSKYQSSAGGWNYGSCTWNAANNVTCSGSGEWSFDCTASSESDTTHMWHVWSSYSSRSILACYPGSCKVTVPNGNLEVGGNIKIASAATMQYNSSEECIEFVF